MLHIGLINQGKPPPMAGDPQSLTNPGFYASPSIVNRSDLSGSRFFSLRLCRIPIHISLLFLQYNGKSGSLRF